VAKPLVPLSSLGPEIAQLKQAQQVLAFLHGYFDGGAECRGLNPAQCADAREALAAWINANWVEPS
jgi:hypothetical protein